MPDLPPPSSGFSDPQLAAILEQAKARRRRAITIFVAVALVLGVGLGSSALYSSAQAKKKRNVAYSRVVKCLFGKPIDAGEPPMSRVRAAWRARLLADQSAKGDGTATEDDKEAAKAKMWPNRCVSQLMAFTDTLKDIGEMKEGDKDLGYYSRDLSKQTAGDNWKKVDTYQAAVESFVGEAQKGNFEFVDVPDVQAPDLLDAQPIDALFPKSSALEDTHIDSYATSITRGASARFFVPAGKGKPPRLCTTSDGKELACAALGFLPPQAAGIPWVLSAEDGAPALLAFGREGGVADGSSVSTGVYRSSDGAQLVGPDTYYVVGGYAKSDGQNALLLKEAADPRGDKFVIGRTAAAATKIETEKVALKDWNEEPSGVAVVGPYVMWVTDKDELHARSAFLADAPVTTIATLPGRLRAAWHSSAFSACQTKKGLVATARVRADGLDRILVVPATDSGFGKAQTTDDGSLTCSDDAAVIVGDETLTTCDESGCKGSKIAPAAAGQSVTAIDGVVVRVTAPSGLLVVEWEKDGKSIAKKVYDAQMKGTVLLGESKLASAALVSRRGYGLLVVDIGGTQRVARLDAAGGIAATSFKP